MPCFFPERGSIATFSVILSSRVFHVCDWTEIHDAMMAFWIDAIGMSAGLHCYSVPERAQDCNHFT